MTVALPTRVSIRRATLADDHVVRDLFGALHAHNAALNSRFALADGWDAVLADHLAHVRAAGHGISLLAWRDDRPVGLAMLDGHTDSPLFRHRYWAELLALYVAPEVRGSGTADALVEVGVRWAVERGFDRLQLYVTATNVPAKRFYARSGFRPLQEIWVRDLGSSPVEPPPDPTCEAGYAHGHRLLTTAHHLLVDDEPCSPDTP